MEFGCIGAPIAQSFSADIHARIGRYAYELREVLPDDLPGFMEARDFVGVNVTIPHKQAVLPLLDWVSENAAAIGAVNTVVNRSGKLYGYNTDAPGLRALIEHAGLTGAFADAKVLVLGTGGTSRTACFVARHLGAAQVMRVSRSGREGAVTYAQAVREHADARIVVNTTPCGMYPQIDSAPPLDLAAFPQLEGVLDVVYNPVRTQFVQSAQALGVPAEGGLFMLVAQAVCAAELFTGEQLAVRAETERIFAELCEVRAGQDGTSAGRDMQEGTVPSWM